ncbi:MAG: MFS transporter, partial [Boseongicola sp.]|nr:MFS transporter [Boseongicola sp.]
VGHVVIAPLAEALLRGMPRKSAMIGLGLGRVLLLVPMAFVATMLRIATLTFASFVLAPAFTTLYQSVVPDVPPETVTFALALARSWIAYALEAALGPAISAALLGVKWAEHLFPAAALALVGSILARLATRFPARAFGDGRKPILERAVIGLRICSHTPRIRCPVLLNLALMLASAWVLVKSVVFVGLRPGDAG